ncbi:hypothetical protein G3480_11925 [Thiorhodococcus mannitoliphagus]|uniref:CheW-like domain-containing protein n=1 Tax=Thiorhodococcus mannitoliphagus TaxID=329406 RepID=A0A6P1DVJ6_9GAMM|nr:hypothetical protein [Thiorhodococcus mannitoliphagus]NEX21011.1 hypothetical protein [Thiorhodococcus mannitoliphagus]
MDPLATDVSGIDLVRFGVGALTLAVERVKVRGMCKTQDPFAPSLATLLQIPQSAAAATPLGRLLEFDHPEGPHSLRVDEPVIHWRLPTSALRPLPPLLAARQSLACVRALAYIGHPPDDRLIIVLDAWQLPRLATAADHEDPPVLD